MQCARATSFLPQPGIDAICQLFQMKATFLNSPAATIEEANLIRKQTIKRSTSSPKIKMSRFDKAGVRQKSKHQEDQITKSFINEKATNLSKERRMILHFL